MKKTLFFVLSFIVAMSTVFVLNTPQEKETEKVAKDLNTRALFYTSDTVDDPEKRNAPGSKNKITKTRKIRSMTTLVLFVVISFFFCSNVHGFEFYPPIYVQKNTNQYRLGIDFMDEDKIFRVCILNESESGYFRFETAEKEEMDCYKVDIFMIPAGQSFEDTSSIIDYLPKITTLTKDSCYTRLNPGKYYAVLRKISRTEYNPVYAVLTSAVALKGSD